jgi:hypothetical protein
LSEQKGSKGTITEEDLEFEALEEDENGQEVKDNGQEGKDNYKDNYTDGGETLSLAIVNN